MKFDKIEDFLPEAIKARINAPKKRTRGDAITRLCKAISRNVRDNSDTLAATLFERALQGDVNCTKLLVALIERLPPPKPRKVRSMAAELANSPQWTGPPLSEQPNICAECEFRDVIARHWKLPEDSERKD